MRILIVSQYYPPEGAAAFYAASMAEELARRGHSVRVLTGFPNYPTGDLYPGYKMRWRAQETGPEGVQILRVPLYLDHSQSALRRIINYTSFGVSSALARSWVREADVTYVYATQMTPALGPWVRRLLGGTPYVLHIQDLWPDSITGSSLVRRGLLQKVVERCLNPWLRSVYTRASAVVAIAPTMRETLLERGVSSEKLHLVYNWSGEPEHPAVARGGSDEASHAKVLRLLYAGNVGDMQDLETAVEAAHHARGHGVELTVVGDGVALDRVRSTAQALGATNIRFVGRVPLSETERFYREADFSLVTLKDLPTFRGTIPSKFQASLAHGIPVITTVQGDLRKLVEATGVGLTADAQDANSLSSVFGQAALMNVDQRKEMSRSAEHTYRQMFSLESGIEAMEQILVGVAEVPSRAKSLDNMGGSRDVT